MDRPPSDQARLIDHSIEMPAIRDALQLVFTCRLERQARSGHEVLHGLGDKDLGRLGEGCDPCSDRDADPGDLIVDQLAFTRDTCPNLDPQVVNAVGCRETRTRLDRWD
jgi:hypothetical protein